MAYKGEAELWGQEPQALSEEVQVLPGGGQAQLAEPDHRGLGKSASRTHTPTQDSLMAKRSKMIKDSVNMVTRSDWSEHDS